MKIAIGQINPVIGDFRANRERILEFAKRAERADIIVFPELSLSGYPPLDLLEQDSFVEQSLGSLRLLQKDLPKGIAVVVGLVDRSVGLSGKPLQNVAAVILDGEIVFRQAKTLLPTYDVFDEARYFESAKTRNAFELDGKRIGIAICEDIWMETGHHPGVNYPVDPVKELLDLGIDIMLVPSASPFFRGKSRIRRELVGSIAKEGAIPVVYANMTGANDSLVFDGKSFFVDAAGNTVRMLGSGEELGLYDTEESLACITAADDPWQDVREVLVMGIRDYMKKCGFRKAHLGLSGGIDSALVAALAVEAVGKENVKGFALPSRYSSPGSKDDAYELAANLGIECETIPIEKPFQAFLDSLAPAFRGAEANVTEENLQARVRGTLLMAYSNKFDSMLLATGNKSELATGYCTLYGDMCGALAVIGDLLKTEVYALCERINRDKTVIPRATMEKPPSAELRPDQKDQDSLPPYDLLDAILEAYLVQNLSCGEIVARGHDPELVSRVIGMVAKAEYKRRQAPPVLKVSVRAFGIGRRIPIARVIHES